MASIRSAPRMADSWAAAAMMAGHPNGVSMLSLRNVPFALQVGGNDAAYNRNKVGKEYGEQLDKLQKDDPKGYEHFVKIHEGKGALDGPRRQGRLAVDGEVHAQPGARASGVEANRHAARPLLLARGARPGGKGRLARRSRTATGRPSTSRPPRRYRSY